MKKMIVMIFLMAFNVSAQDPASYISSFDNKIYTLKTKGVRDFVVDLESSKLTKEMNDQMVFGKVNELVFRVYWTASPERLAIDVLGLPEGFREVKETLKATILGQMDSLLPLGVKEKFKGYQITAGPNPKEFIARDQSGVAGISTYVLKFDSQDTLREVVGKRDIGRYDVVNSYEKEKFSDGKWVFKKEVTTVEESGQSSVSTRELSYGEQNGVGVLREVDMEIVQTWEKAEVKPVKIQEKLVFKNYKINSGEALKYFLGDSPKK